MATSPKPTLTYADSCGDCGQRTVQLPKKMPDIGDDFDWLVRDYDGFRLFMLEELAGRFPERTNWTPADIEVIFVEALSVVLDQLSDTLDRAHTEAFLDSARRPESVRRLLSLIGYDAVLNHYSLSWSDTALVKHILIYKGYDLSGLNFEPIASEPATLQRLLVFLGESANALGPDPDLSDRETERQWLQLLGYDADNLREALDYDIPLHRKFATKQLDKKWYSQPHLMDNARHAGPAAIHTNYRMVTLEDYGERVEDHPLVLRAASNIRWTGSWSTIEIVSVLSENGELDNPIDTVLSGKELLEMQYAVDDFHWKYSLPNIDWHLHPTFRSVIKSYVDRYRMVGQEVWLQDATPIGLNISLSVQVANNYFQSEIRQAIGEAMSTDPGGFFEPGKLAFGEDLYASDLIETLMSLDGVDAVCLNKFKRVGDRYPDESGSGVIQLNGTEIARCDNIVGKPSFGYWRLALHGGQRG